MSEEIFNNLTVTLFDKEESFSINISNYYNKTIIQDLKCLLYLDLNKLNKNDKFNINNLLRDKIIVDQNFKEYIGKDILLKTNIEIFERNKKTKIYEAVGEKKIELGYFHVLDEYTIKPSTINNDYLFDLIEKHTINDYSGIWNNLKNKKCLNDYMDSYYKQDKSKIIKKYIYNGMFELYYKMLLEEAKMNNLNRISGKASAMCSYLATKKVFNDFFNRNGYDLEVSNPNVFIKDNNIEYDAVIIKKNKNNTNKYIFDTDEVIAIIELKTSGCFYSKEQLDNNEFINYIKNSNPLNKKFIYLSLYESFGDKKTSIHYYEYLLCNISSIANSYGIFCATKRNQKTILIPYEYDLDEILNNIFKGVSC